MERAYGSAAVVCDGAEAVVGVRAEVRESGRGGSGGEDGGDLVRGEGEVFGGSEESWVEVSIDTPGGGGGGGGGGQQRDEENMVVFLEQMIHEGLVADGDLEARLCINRRWHWKLFIDVCTHLALFLSLSYIYTTTSSSRSSSTVSLASRSALKPSKQAKRN